MSAQPVESRPVCGRPLTDNHYRRLLDAAPDGIVGVDASGQILLVNTQAERMFGYTREELLGKSVEILIPERFRRAHPAHREHYCAHAAIRPMGLGLDLRAVRADGTEFAVDINLSPFEGESGAEVVCMIRDVTDRKVAEEQIKHLNSSLEERSCELAAMISQLEIRNRDVERANRLMSNFLATMSHELRTPLNAIVGYSDLLARQSPGPLTQKQERFLGHIKGSSRHLLALINDILDISKIEAGCLDLRFEPFPLSVAADEVLSTLRPLAAEKEIEFTMDVCPEWALDADRVRVKQMLFNLLSNAIKFTPPRGSVRLCATSGDGFTHISVIDTGMGIPVEEHEAIFEKFHCRAPSGQQGTGLGLAITKLLVEMHGGRIWLQSEPEKGSTFHFTLPSARERAWQGKSS